MNMTRETRIQEDSKRAEKQAADAIRMSYIAV